MIAVAGCAAGLGLFRAGAYTWLGSLLVVSCIIGVAALRTAQGIGACRSVGLPLTRRRMTRLLASSVLVGFIIILGADLAFFCTSAMLMARHMHQTPNLSDWGVGVAAVLALVVARCLKHRVWPLRRSERRRIGSWIDPIGAVIVLGIVIFGSVIAMSGWR